MFIRKRNRADQDFDSTKTDDEIFRLYDLFTEMKDDYKEMFQRPFPYKKSDLPIGNTRCHELNVNTNMFTDIQVCCSYSEYS